MTQLLLHTHFLKKNLFYSLFFLLVSLCGVSLYAQSPIPTFSYLHNFIFADTSLAQLKGPARVIEVDGRQGINMTSIHSVLQLKAHTMKERKGTVSMWGNDLDNSAFMKQPWNYPMAFATRNVSVAKDTWHKLQFLQRGNNLLGAIDGVIMFDCTDNGFTNNGPVLDFGRIAIRCMLRSKMVFRNLRVYNKPTFTTSKIMDGARVRQNVGGKPFNLN